MGLAGLLGQRRTDVGLDKAATIVYLLLGCQCAGVANAGGAKVDAGDPRATPRQFDGVQARATGYVKYMTFRLEAEMLPQPIYLTQKLWLLAAGSAMALIQMLAQHTLAEERIVPRQIGAVAPGHSRLRSPVDAPEGLF